MPFAVRVKNAEIAHRISFAPDSYSVVILLYINFIELNPGVFRGFLRFHQFTGESVIDGGAYDGFISAI
jgi:hypothetical protein